MLTNMYPPHCNVCSVVAWLSYVSSISGVAVIAFVAYTFCLVNVFRAQCYGGKLQLVLEDNVDISDRLVVEELTAKQIKNVRRECNSSDK